MYIDGGSESVFFVPWDQVLTVVGEVLFCFSLLVFGIFKEKRFNSFSLQEVTFNLSFNPSIHVIAASNIP